MSQRMTSTQQHHMTSSSSGGSSQTQTVRQTYQVQQQQQQQTVQQQYGNVQQQPVRMQYQVQQQSGTTSQGGGFNQGSQMPGQTMKSERVQQSSTIQTQQFGGSGQPSFNQGQPQAFNNFQQPTQAQPSSAPQRQGQPTNTARGPASQFQGSPRAQSQPQPSPQGQFPTGQQVFNQAPTDGFQGQPGLNPSSQQSQPQHVEHVSPTPAQGRFVPKKMGSVWPPPSNAQEMPKEEIEIISHGMNNWPPANQQQADPQGQTQVIPSGQPLPSWQPQQSQTQSQPQVRPSGQPLPSWQPQQAQTKPQEKYQQPQANVQQSPAQIQPSNQNRAGLARPQPPQQPGLISNQSAAAPQQSSQQAQPQRPTTLQGAPRTVQPKTQQMPAQPAQQMPAQQMPLQPAQQMPVQSDQQTGNTNSGDSSDYPKFLYSYPVSKMGEGAYDAYQDHSYDPSQPLIRPKGDGHLAKEWPPKHAGGPNMTMTYPSAFKLRDEAPIDHQTLPMQSVPSQPAFKITQPMRKTGDEVWPPRSGAQDEPTTEVRDFVRPEKSNRNYSDFFAANQLPNNFPGYRAPPGTQHVGDMDEAQPL